MHNKSGFLSQARTHTQRAQAHTRTHTNAHTHTNTRASTHTPSRFIYVGNTKSYSFVNKSKTVKRI